MIQRITLEAFTAETVSTYGVVCLDMKEKLDPEAFVKLSERLGKTLPFNLSKYRSVDSPSEITILDNLGDGITASTSSFGEGWHQDSSFLPNPPEYTVLHALDVPSDGGDTFFTDTRLAWERTPEKKRQILRGINLVHSVRDSYRLMPSDVGQTLEALLQTLPKAPHPLVLKHPRGGETLYLSPLYIKGNLYQEQQEIYSEILESVLIDQVTHRWEPGHILAWDNRVVLHAATGYGGKERRHLMRTVVEDIGSL